MQRILVFQQNGRAEAKIQGIETYGEGRFVVDVISIDVALPPILDSTEDYLPKEIHADLVLDFLKHPDLSGDLARLCSAKSIPVVASGKKHHVPGVFVPPT